YVAAYSFFDALAIVFGNAIRGAGDVRFSLYLSSLLGWFVMAIPCFVIANYTSVGLYGCWAAATANIVLLGIGMMLRFRQGHWRTMRVIE
ncbi:MAG: MATE family efflux transporter, partial [Planctomycetaceae bacterium]|nr:MATE family efflux transporter [Planctomycetaceae bacterium]